MKERSVSTDGAKVDAIRAHFAPLLGAPIACYRTAELFHEDGTWSSWPDLPIRLYANESLLVSISWSCFDDLWLTNDETVPAWAEEPTTRWVENGIAAINGCLGRPIRSVLLGRGEMKIENREIEIWTRLVIDLDDCLLEVFNALDENGYQLHDGMPSGEFVNCI